MAMTNPSVTELLNHAECRYTLVVKVSKRARELIGGEEPLVDAEDKKPLSIAVEEVSLGLIEHHPAKEGEA